MNSNVKPAAKAVVLALLASLAGCGSDSGGGSGGAGAPRAVATSFLMDLTQVDEQVLAGQLFGFDPDGDGLTFALAQAPANGNVQIAPDGSFYYAPHCGFTGDADTFTFTVNDGASDSAPATVSVAVSGELAPFLNAAPITAVNMEQARVYGPLARGGISDFVLENEKVRVIIQGAGRRWGTINPFGGTLLDMVPRCSDRGVPLDHWEEHAAGINLETTYNPDSEPAANSIQVINDGSDGNAAVIQVVGEDDLIDFINGSSAIRSLGFSFPSSADDVNLPVTITATYTLAPGANFVRQDVSFVFTGSQPRGIYIAEYLNGSGEVEVFQHGLGFGEALAALPCDSASKLQATANFSSIAPAGNLDPCTHVIYGGHERGAGVSYGFLHRENGSSSVSVSGVTVPVFNTNAVAVFLGAEHPAGGPYTLQPSPLPSSSLSRWWVVGQGTVSQVLDQRNAIFGITTGTLSGTVTRGGEPVAQAEVAVTGNPYSPGPSTNVVNHTRTGPDGTYSMTLPPGNYNVLANLDGHLFPATSSVAANVGPGASATADFEFVASAALQVSVRDSAGARIPAKVQLVGFDPSPDPLNVVDILGALTTTTGIFGDPGADGLTYGIAFAEPIGKTGESPVWTIEPGEYELVVSHGPRFSIHSERITLEAGLTTEVDVRLAQVVKTPGFVASDFHVHGIDSPDSEVSNVERVLTYLADGMDFFTPSDHEMRVNYAPTIAAMRVGHLLGTAPSAEITTFDYGHFNSWPVSVTPGLLGGGTVDWGGAAPVGTDFPSEGHYSLTPAQLIAAAHADPNDNIVQINHYYSHMGPEGLDIDTGMEPPQSFVAAAERRLDPGQPNFFTDTFDTLEIWIGEGGRAAYVDNFLGRNFGDWVNMLNQGIVRSAVADSDTHDRRKHQLSARTYVASAVTDPAQLGANAAVLAANVKAGRAIGTNGPFVQVQLSAASTGDTATHAVGNPLIVSTTDGAVDVTITVSSPVWAEFDTVEVYVNSPTESYDQDADAGTRNVYRVAPQFTYTTDSNLTVETVTDVPMLPGAQHLEATITETLTGLTEDSWIIVMVKGTDGVSRPIFPMDPHDIGSATNATVDDLTDGNLGEGGVMALAFSNPLFVDVDGNGEYDAPGLKLTP